MNGAALPVNPGHRRANPSRSSGDFHFHTVILGFMIKQMPVCTQANEVAESGSEFIPSLHLGDAGLFGAVPSVPHRSEQTRRRRSQRSRPFYS